MWWENPSVTQQAIADRVGVSRKAVNEAFQTEAWEVTRREYILDRIPELVPAAWKALRLQWEKGNAAGALDVLRWFGAIGNAKVEVNHELDTLLDIIRAEAGIKE
jgi:hypothetical protein